MKIREFGIAGVRCFQNTGHIHLSPQCNVFVGRNNAGKSTILKSVLAFQGHHVDKVDIRQGSQQAYVFAHFDDFGFGDRIALSPTESFSTFSAVCQIVGGPPNLRSSPERPLFHLANSNQSASLFFNEKPLHTLVPFLANRKTQIFEENVSVQAHTSQVTGTLRNLYGEVDLLATANRPNHLRFQAALRDIVNLPITTRPSSNGKQAGMYLNEEDEASFITFDQMGDGVAEMVGLIAQLCIAKRKIFLLEEPETHLHPGALKALLGMVRESSKDNQFLIATHSNIVLRELGYDQENKIFNVYRDDDDLLASSNVEPIELSSLAHISVLRELGYEFADYGLHDAWLFLEESSAETIIREILVPNFVPELAKKLRTFSAAGASNLEPSVAEFKRLVTFVYLQPVYRDRMWVRADNDAPGNAAITKLKQTFPDFDEGTCSTFSKEAFELFYPERYAQKARDALGIADRKQKNSAKQLLLKEVLAAPLDADLKKEWAASAIEVVNLLEGIRTRMKLERQ